MKNPLFRLPVNKTREAGLALRVNLAFLFGELVTLGFFSFQVSQTPPGNPGCCSASKLPIQNR